MAYTGIQMFMEKLNQLINSHHIPSINNPEIICQRPQFQLLYEELGSMIQTLFIDQHQHLHDLEKVGDLKKRFIDAAEEAEYIVDLFLTGVHIRKNGHFPTSEDFKRSLNLDDVRRSFKSVEVEFMSMIMDSMKVGSSQRPERTLNQSAPAPIPLSRNLLGSKKLVDEMFVGIDRDAELIRDKLVEDQKKLDVVSIVGMGGIGKTTLATKVFNDVYVKHHFYVRVWVTVSQTYDKRAVLTQILESIRGQLDLEKANDSRLRELVHKNLMGKRYLIVIDDIWDNQTWDNLKVFFPHDNTGSRILLTSRNTEVAKHANADGFIHHLDSLNKEKSWKLLCHKVFHGSECPEWSIEPGMKIVESCKGLPLAVVVIAGVLAKEAWNKWFWVHIAERTGLYIVGDQNGRMETLALSYNHLPHHLRECLLYLGGFREDHKFYVKWLIWLWVAEGFIKKDGNRSLEDIAEGYLMDLIDRNLVIVDRWKSNGGVKACKVHDLIRELCLKNAKEEGFIRKIERLTLSSQLSKVKKPPYRPERMLVDKAFAFPSAQNCRSVLVFGDIRSLGDDIAKHFHSFLLLRVLDLLKLQLNDFPKGMELLVHLRYLSIWTSSEGLPSSICNLWNLQTLIFYISKHECIILPSNMSNLVNLRHLRSYPSIERPMKNLQTISTVKLGDGVDNFHKCIPYIKELTCTIDLEKENDFQSLIYLEKLNLHSKVLKLKRLAFEGSCWNTDRQEFPQLKFLSLYLLDIKEWEANSRSFPCLRQLQIIWCTDLEEIPLEIGDIPTLELIQIEECRHSVGESKN